MLFDISTAIDNTTLYKCPIQIGQAVWLPGKRPKKCIVKFIGINEEYIFFNVARKWGQNLNMFSFKLDELGKYIFLSEEEALNCYKG